MSHGDSTPTSVKIYPGSRLTFIRVAGRRNKNNDVYWLCRCKCGREVVVRAASVRNGHTQSCGCLHLESIRPHCTHGKSGDLMYKIWKNMYHRCHNKKHISYKNYGGRGIRVCAQWLDEAGFSTFFADMGERPTDKHSLDRINNDGDYCPENCRWATRKEQSRNTRQTVLITFQGETMCLKDWATRLGLTSDAVKHRIREWGVESALSTNGRTRKSTFTDDQVREIRRRTASGEKQVDLSREFKVRHSVIWKLVARKTYIHVTD